MTFAGAAFRATAAVRWAFRGNLTSKRGNAIFYKGRGAPSMGHIAKGSDQYIVDRVKYARNTFNVPNLKGFKLKPYIAPQTERRKVARPQLVLSVDLRSKMLEQKRIRVAKMQSLLPIIKGKDSSKRVVSRSRNLYMDLLQDLTHVKDINRRRTKKGQELGAKRAVLRKERAEVALKKEQRLTQFKEELATRHAAFLQGKRGEELPAISSQASRYQKYKQAERFKTFIELRHRKHNKHVTTIKSQAAQQQNV